MFFLIIFQDSFVYCLCSFITFIILFLFLIPFLFLIALLFIILFLSRSISLFHILFIFLIPFLFFIPYFPTHSYYNAIPMSHFQPPTRISTQMPKLNWKKTSPTHTTRTRMANSKKMRSSDGCSLMRTCPWKNPQS